ncbi:MAG: alpha/beta hydrolase [Acidimicrobiia bacterium]
MHEGFDSSGLRLACHLARPAGFAKVPGLVLCHGFPRGPRGSVGAASTYSELAERLAREAGWAVLAFNFRGTGASEGDFSPDGWLADQRRAVDVLEERSDVTGVFLAGSSAGGALGVCLAAEDPRVRGVVTLAAPATFSAWAANPLALAEMAKRAGVLRSPGYPPDPVVWAEPLLRIEPLPAAAKLAPRPLLVIHGDADEVVPVGDARSYAAAGGVSAELRVVPGAGHRLRHDPRAIALLIGWLTRQEA